MKIKQILVRILVFCLFALTVGGCIKASTSEKENQNAINTAVAKTLGVVTTQLAVIKSQPTITQALPTFTPISLISPSPISSPQITPVTATATKAGDKICDWAYFMGDITYADGTLIQPGSKFTKTWEIKNIGTCNWTSDYKIFFYDGDLLGAEREASLTSSEVYPGQTVRVSVPMVVPDEEPQTPARVFRGYWKFKNAKGEIFGAVGADNMIRPVWVEIRVGFSYDLIANICAATWKSTAGNIACPVVTQDAYKGYFYTDSHVTGESGEVVVNPSLVMVPPLVDDGQIWAQYPPILIYPYSRFKFQRIGCLNEKTGCNYNFKVTYSVEGGAEVKLFEYDHTYGAAFSRYDQRLDTYGLVGKNVAFILYITANGTAHADNIAFIEFPRISPRDQD